MVTGSFAAGINRPALADDVQTFTYSVASPIAGSVFRRPLTAPTGGIQQVTGAAGGSASREPTNTPTSPEMFRELAVGLPGRLTTRGTGTRSFSAWCFCRWLLDRTSRGGSSKRGGDPRDDLCSGRVGLVNAAVRFDVKIGVDPSPALHEYGEVRRHFRDNSWSVGVPGVSRTSHLVARVYRHRPICAAARAGAVGIGVRRGARDDRRRFAGG